MQSGDLLERIEARNREIDRFGRVAWTLVVAAIIGVVAVLAIGFTSPSPASDVTTFAIAVATIFGVIYSTSWFSIRSAREHTIRAESQLGRGNHSEAEEELRLARNAIRIW